MQHKNESELLQINVNLKPMTTFETSILNHSNLLSSELKHIAQKIFKGDRITFDEGVYLYNNANLSYLGTLANFVREKKKQELRLL